MKWFIVNKLKTCKINYFENFYRHFYSLILVKIAYKLVKKKVINTYFKSLYSEKSTIIQICNYSNDV